MHCSVFWYDTPSKSPGQRHCPYLHHTEQGSTCRNCCDDIYCSVRVFRFPAIFYCCRNWPQNTEGSCTQLYWNNFVPLLSSPPLACRVACTVLRLLCLEGEMQFFCSGDPSSWPLRLPAQICRDTEQCRNGEGKVSCKSSHTIKGEGYLTLFQQFWACLLCIFNVFPGAAS